MSPPSARQRLLLLQEDDCAPDARQSFEQAFPTHSGGLSLLEFQGRAHRECSDDGMTIFWRLGELELSISGDDPFYALHRITAPGTMPTPITIECYQASDGSIWRSITDAQAREDLLEFKAWYESNKLCGRYEGSSVEFADFLEWLIENKAFLAPMLKSMGRFESVAKASNG